MSMFTIVGILGILLISVGVLLKNRLWEDIVYIFGGLCLEVYSIYQHDIIFIILQIIFIVAALIDLARQLKRKQSARRMNIGR